MLHVVFLFSHINIEKLFICSENLIRVAFQCLQLVVTDFLPVMPWRCLPLCVDTAAKFGSQTQELNISLTAVGLMVCGNDQKNMHNTRSALLAALDYTLWIFPFFRLKAKAANPFHIGRTCWVGDPPIRNPLLITERQYKFVDTMLWTGLAQNHMSHRVNGSC